MILKIIIFLLLGAGLLACSSVNTILVNNEQVSVTNEYEKVNSADSIILPYRKDLNKEMLEVIGFAPQSFERGRPDGSLNNWSTDVILNSQLEKIDKTKPIFCILNFGGLRNPISKGDVTLADVFKLMPFDNEIVIAELPISSIAKIEAYQKIRGGEPIAGAKIQNGNFVFNNPIPGAKTMLIVTSDYLFNGGDHMDFFQDNIDVQYAGELMRDVMIEAVKKQETLIWSDEKRIDLGE
ncbi:MAG: 5'-nucleotidase C-terminal domain-containing protein [Flavobacteriales bacterium]|nr:5'-nucleotidase C-terminal domain-containing protein [Flavobacteriales bacterium]